mmetsp:Transcript_21852/g.45924  ORF Transcript_21852/g.45924 Transcript_21852/m.45924 type:complete len:109 (-) Transcript_21852:3594-3920(-)
MNASRGGHADCFSYSATSAGFSILVLRVASTIALFSAGFHCQINTLSLRNRASQVINNSSSKQVGFLLCQVNLCCIRYRQGSACSSSNSSASAKMIPVIGSSSEAGSP